MTAASDVRTWAAFAGAVVFGGANVIAVSLGNRELPPFAAASARFALAAVLFGLLARSRRLPGTTSRQRLGAAWYGIIGFGAAYACLYTALLKLTAGTTAVVLASVPVMTLLIAVIVGQERVTARGVAGGAIAIAGIAVLSAGKIGGEVPIGSLLAALGGAVSSAWATVIAKSMPDVNPIHMNAYGMGAGAVFLVGASVIAGESWVLPEHPSTVVAFAWLVTFGSVGLFGCFLYVVRRWTASAAVYVLTVMPVVAGGLGALLLDQPVRLGMLGGAALIALAVWVGAVPQRVPADEPLGAEPTTT